MDEFTVRAKEAADLATLIVEEYANQSLPPLHETTKGTFHKALSDHLRIVMFTRPTAVWADAANYVLEDLEHSLPVRGPRAVDLPQMTGALKMEMPN